MALVRTIVGVLAVIAMTIAPACALSRAPHGAASAIGGHHEGGAAAHCGVEAEKGDRPDAATALCAFFCGFFLTPADMAFAADFEPLHFATVSLSIESSALEPPAPPPRA